MVTLVIENHIERYKLFDMPVAVEALQHVCALLNPSTLTRVEGVRGARQDRLSPSFPAYSRAVVPSAAANRQDGRTGAIFRAIVAGCCFAGRC